MSVQQRGLGRGLSALLGEQAAEPAAAPEAATGTAQGGPRETPIELLERNPDQPRRTFTEAELTELAASIREKGVIQPILVRPAPDKPGRFQIVAGERRWRAAQLAALTTVPVIERQLDDLEVLEVALVENVQREDLNPVEEARAYSTLMERFGHTQEGLSRVVGKSRSHVANTTRLLSLPEPVLDHLAAGRLSAGHARALVTAAEPVALAEKIVADGLNVRQAEKLAKGGADGAGRGKSRGGETTTPDSLALQQDLADALGLKVELKDRGGRGELVIRYATLEQLDDLCSRLMRGA